MPIESRRQQLVDDCLDRIERSRGRMFTPEQRAQIHEVAGDKMGDRFMQGISELSPKELDDRVEGIVRLALIPEFETLPVPDAVTAEIFDRTSDSDLASMIYDHVCTGLNAVPSRDSTHFRNAVLDLPRGQRVVYNLFLLDGEIYNGGFGQLFSNSSGEFAEEMLQDCRLVGAIQRAAILEDAIGVWKRLETEGMSAIEPEFDALSFAYHRLKDVELLEALITRYLRDHPEECVTK